MILGIDASTKKTGYSIFDEDELIEYGVFRTTSDDTKERMKEIYNWVSFLVDKYNIDDIVLEDVPVSSHKNLKTGKDLSILQGVVLAICFKLGISYHIYNPSAWRAIIGTFDGSREGTKREAQKKAAVDKVNELYGLNFVYNETETKTRFTDDDKAEAILIGLAYLKDK